MHNRLRRRLRCSAAKTSARDEHQAQLPHRSLRLRVQLERASVAVKELGFHTLAHTDAAHTREAHRCVTA